MARAIRTGNTQMLGFIGGDLCEEQVGCMLAGALDEADQCGYTLKILPHHDREDDAQQMIRRSSELRLMGVVALHLPLSIMEQLYAEAQHCEYPFVVMDSRVPIQGVHQVVSDDNEGVAKAIDHLVRLGHSKIAMISGDPISTLIPLREAAYRGAMQRHKLSVPDYYVRHGNFRFHAASEKAAEALLQLPVEERPTAILCAGDLIALALLQVATRLQILVPQQLSVIGFANLKVAEFCVPTLTTVEQSFQEMGRTAVRWLLSSLHHKGVHHTSDVSNTCGKAHNGLTVRNERSLELLPTQLIERESTAVVSM
jgi:DNA-binding LacI/PurR family transcriptional regulator